MKCMTCEYRNWEHPAPKCGTCDGGSEWREEKPKTPAPVFGSPNGWYFWNETWSHSIGPYSTEYFARMALKFYADMLNGREDSL